MFKRILLISYDNGLLIARRTLLEQEGYRVSSALGFREAMRASEDGSFDLLILGHSIPRADKEEFIRAFRGASTLQSSLSGRTTTMRESQTA